MLDPKHMLKIATRKDYIVADKQEDVSFTVLKAIAKCHTYIHTYIHTMYIHTYLCIHNQYVHIQYILYLFFIGVRRNLMGQLKGQLNDN